MIRPANLDDLDALVMGNMALAKETEDIDLDHDTLRQGVLAILTGTRSGRYYVGELDEQVACQLMITFEWSDWRNGYVWWIQSVYVHTDHRQKGWYRRLYEHVRAEAEQAGSAGLRLYVDRRNTRAQTVYAKLGMDGDHYTLFEAMFR